MQYGCPYMGSKSKICSSIAMNFPKAENFYDLFGGGFSMTHYMMVHKAKRYQHFHYNEIQNDLVELVKKAISGDFNYDRFKPEWITKDMFHARKDEAYVRTLWSFGNSGKTYLFSEDIEPYKKSIHMAIVFEEFDSLAIETLGFSKWPKEANTIKKRRFYLRQKLAWYNEKKKIPKCLYQFLDEKQLKRIGVKDNIKQLEQLQQLERLEQLQQLERLEQPLLTTSALDYREVEIKPNSVVYCDIPYAGTADYAGSFCHKTFFDWAMSRDFPVYVSEYDVPDKRFKLVYSIKKRQLFAQGGTELVKEKDENLYWNGKSC